MKRWYAVVLCALLAVVWVGCGGNPPASLEFVEISPVQPRIGEITTIRFKATDSRGQPMAGAQVTFKTQGDVPNVTISPATATTTKGTGIAETQLIAKGRVSSVVVIAESEGKTAISPPITFAGAAPNAKQFTFECGEAGGEASGGLRAILAYDEGRALIPGIAARCIAHVADRNGDGVTGAQVSFLTEAGAIGPTDKTISDRVGNASVIYKTSLPLPHATDPDTFSWSPSNDGKHIGDYLVPLWMMPYEWTQNPIIPNAAEKLQEPRRPDPVIPGRTNNPRDNLVAMIAVTTGEESFDDVNNNGVRDENEPYTDTTEPFVDSNDNGTWDPDERYVDTNNNSAWDGKNGAYDASTLIWVQNKLLWTGIPNAFEDIVLSANNPKPIFRQIAPSTPPDIVHFGCASFIAVVSDPWFNSLARNSNDDGCTIEGSTTVIASPSSFGTGIRLTYPAATSLFYGVCDAHDPNGDPVPPQYSAPVPFSIIGTCQYTASQLSPLKYKLSFAAGSGTIL